MTERWGENDVWVKEHDYISAAYRLADYEDTGLTPGECKNAVEMEEVLMDEYCSIDRMVELMRADKEGRVVILPCKVGDTVYWPKNQRAVVDEFFGYHKKRYLHAQFFDDDGCIDIPFDEFGKTVFLTREEAEEALRRQNNG